MRHVKTRSPSFPSVVPDELLSEIAYGERWQVLCGDEAHWRVGVYSPPESCAQQIEELELHDCPEFFLLLSGNVTLVIHDQGRIRHLPLRPNRPILVTRPHAGFCPDGPFTGTALVVERDSFGTEYRTPEQWNMP